MPQTDARASFSPTSPRILLVEDEFIIAMYMRRLLEKLGAQVEGPFATGEEALRGAERFRPDLVLMDIKLAGEMDGVETADRLRARSPAAVVFTSAFSDEETRSRAAGVNPAGFLTKPVEEGDLSLLLSRMFGAGA